MSFNISSPYEYFSELARHEEHPAEGAPSELQHSIKPDAVSGIMAVYKQFGIDASTSRGYGDVVIHVSRESLHKWLASQRAISTTLSIDVPTFIKIVTSHQLEEVENRQVGVALRALNEKEAADFAKREDLPHIEAFVRFASLQEDVSSATCDSVAQTLFQANQERDSNLERLFKMVADKSTPKKEIIALLEKGVVINSNATGRTLLMDAAEAGHVEAIEALVAHGAKLDQRDGFGQTALYLAVRENQLGAVETLRVLGANVNQCDEDGYTPLHFAASEGIRGTVESLIRLGASINQANKDGSTPLHLACRFQERLADSDHLGTIKALIEAGANVDQISTKDGTPLQSALRAGKGEAITLFIDRDSYVSKSTAAIWKLLDASKLGGEVPDLVKLKDLQQVHEFFEAIPSVNDWPHEKNELLQEMQARFRQARGQRLYNTNRLFEELANEIPNIPEIKTIIEQGIDVAKKTGKEETLLTIAARTGNRDVVQLLLAAGADINLKLADGSTALTHAIVSGDHQALAILSEFGADVNQEWEGETPLMIAISRGDLQSVKLLLEKGAEVNTVTKKGTALHVSAQDALFSEDGFEKLELLLQKGVSLTSRNEAGESVMHVAAQQGELKVIRALIEKGADASLADSKGKTPLDIILGGFADGNKDTIAFLIEKGYGQKLVRCMLQHGGNPGNIQALLQLAPTVDLQELLRDINFDVMRQIHNIAGSDDTVRGFMERFVRASLNQQWVGSDIPANEILSRLRRQPFLIRPAAESPLYTIQASGRESEEVEFRYLMETWIHARGNPADMLVEFQLSQLSRREGAYQLEVARSAIDEDPQVALGILCDMFQEAVCKELEITFMGEKGQDVGGLGRQFVSQLFFALSRNLGFARMENGLMRPAIRENSEGDFPPLTDTEKTTYRNIGELMMFCLNAEVPYPAGMLFDQGVFVALTQLDPDDLQNEFASIDLSDPEKFASCFKIYKEMNRFIEDDVTMIQRLERSLKPQNREEWIEAEQTAKLDPEFQKGKWEDDAARQAAIQAAVQKYVVENKLKPALAPLFEVAKGMQEAPFDDPINFQEVQNMQPVELSRSLQGTVSKEDILNKLRFTDIPENIQDWFRNWVQEADTKQIEDLIFALSGSSAIGKDAVIKIKDEGQFLFHTCFNTFGVKCAAINSEDDLKKNLAWALEYARAQGGFDIA